jgi:S-DNA-T family DNA segregation ATPase FtsK/SpoIIIE
VKRKGDNWLGLLFDGRGHDVWGLALIVLAAIAAAGIWFSSGAIIGRWLDSATGALFGFVQGLAPIGLAVGGVLLIRGPRQDRPDVRNASQPDESVDDTAPMGTTATGGTVTGSTGKRTAAMVAGAVLAAVVLMGFAHLIAADGVTITGDGMDAYRSSGGLFGAGIAATLQGVIGTWGTAVVLAGLALLAVSLISGRTLVQMARSVATASRPAASATTSWLAGLFRVSGSSEGDFEDSEGSAGTLRPTLYDQDADTPDAPTPKRKRRRKSSTGPSVDVAQPEPTDGEQLDLDLGPGAQSSPWKLPPAKLLTLSGHRDIDSVAIEQRGRVLESALADHGVQTRLIGMTAGPTVTRYELELGTGVKVAKVTSLHKDIAYAMASPDVRILAPIPGRQAIGVEVPNEERQIVAVGDILTSAEAKRATHPLEVAVGRDINGHSVLMNLATMPHLLIAGQTGAGKSSCINSIITSIMMRSTPEQVRLILIDPKRVELTQYDRIPHLLTQVVANPKKAANALAWAVKEMERRYDLLSEVGVRDITGYNAAYDRGELSEALGADREFKRLPFILVVVDELSDLMMVAPRDVEDAICRIAQMARAVGIHLVIATQRPSVNVITGVIKANVPARLAFAVSSSTDSKVILDQPGAERLVGQGDMLLLGPASSAPQRIQGAWVEETEVRAIVATWRDQAPQVEEQYIEGVASEDSIGTGSGGSTGGGDSEDDELLIQAMELVVRSQLGSTSMLQRKLKVGFARAGRIMDLLEQRGVVGPSEGSKAREVLMTVEDFENAVESGEL